MKQRKTIFFNDGFNLIMDKEQELKKEIKELEQELKDREDVLPPHSVRTQQILLIEELETSIEEKKNELAELIKRKSSS